MSLVTTLFVLSIVFILYVLFVYPLLLALLASRRREVSPKPLSAEPRVSILLAVRNGEALIRAKLQCLLGLDYPQSKLQILVADDGSEDQTAECARQFVDKGVEVLSLPARGKACALNTLMQHATGEILFFTDVRQAIERRALRRLLARFGDPTVGVVSGELCICSGASDTEASVGLYWRYEKWIRKNMSRLDSMLGATGCIYAMRRELASPIPPDALLDDVYLPLAAFFRGYRVVMEEEARAYDSQTSLKAEFRRKVRTLAGVYQIIHLYPALITPSNRMLAHFLSHKVARLLLPFATLLAAGASFGLPAGWRETAIGGQLALGLLAVAGLWLPGPKLLNRLSSAVRTYLVLMAATLCAASVAFVPARSLWKPTPVEPARTISE